MRNLMEHHLTELNKLVYVAMGTSLNRIKQVGVCRHGNWLLICYDNK